MNKKTLIGIIVAVVVLVGSGFYWFIQKQPEKYPGELKKVTIGATTQELSTLIWIAEDQRYFHQNGLDAEVNQKSPGRKCNQLVNSG